MKKVKARSRFKYKVRSHTTEADLLDERVLGDSNIYKVLKSLKRIRARYHQAATLYRIEGLNGSYRAIETQKEWIQTSIEQLNNNNPLKHIDDMCKFSKTTVDGSYLLQFAKPFKQVSSLNEMFGKLSSILPTLTEDNRKEVLMLLSSPSLNEEQKAEKLNTMVNFPLDFTESQTLEKKTSLFHSAGKSYDDKAQVKEIVESIVAMCNCENQQPSQLIIGVNDKTNQTNKLQDEIATFYPQMETLDKFQSTFLVPFIKSYTYDNPVLMSSLKYNWYSYNGDLILIIDINYHGDPIICKGGRLPYRCGTSKMVAEGMDLINMVKKLTH